MASLRLEVVTPEATVFSGEVESVFLPGVEGELGVLPGHTPLLTRLVAGELYFTTGGRVSSLAIGEGFAEVTGRKVAVLTDMAIPEEAIDEARVQEAIARATLALKEKALEGEELATTQAALARSLAQLKVKRRRRGTLSHPGTPASSQG
ncbi:ATP synthase F1 subunit epsilon [Candidatus Methylacidithermus pantelleriae]|uniref:ATP synthase epsilon chain n=1 Tax=Candidatus Methylacidithermus pantelleriae TaxID=2744239 RepID=A0A8J2BHF5_9BACT|nr:ATP synthase F1 subunit epsilon [Candidatus Methylacidithermus pantelleriae]CAF0689639.1 ATP synthase, F1 complex, epsilon subunit [Candidatus Methylacidithermus pantelleriae]